MLLRRLGNKAKIAAKISSHFPAHDRYIEPFFGAGGMFFNKRPVAKYNYLNDIDNDVFNLFITLQSNEKDVYKQVLKTPYHKSVWNYLKKTQFDDPVKKAARFLVLSNYGYLGKPETLLFKSQNARGDLLHSIKKTVDFLNKTNVMFNCTDFETFLLKDFAMRNPKRELKTTFVYCDPPYLMTSDNYSNSFTETDLRRLIKCLLNFGSKFAISEFKNPLVLEIAKEFNLNVIEICTRQTLKNRNTEILLTNYKTQNTLF